MLVKNIFVVVLLLLTACERDPLSDKGKLQLPVKETTTSANETAKPSAVITESDKNIQPVTSDIKELGWDDLIPEEWLPDPVLIEKYNNGEIDDKDPRIIALRIRMEELQKRAPVNKKLDGKTIKLPGFVVPLEGDGKKVSEFLLVPYHGACIHVPPPPSNQTVFVKMKDGSAKVRRLFDTVMITGTMKIEKVKHDIAEAGYTLYADKVESFE